MSSTERGLRIGMITPSSNTCLEPTTYRLLAGIDGVSAHFARLTVTRIALDESSDAQFSVDALGAAAESLADAKVDVVIWNGTSGSWLGVGHDRTLAEQLAKVTGAPATTSTLALLEACGAYGVTRLGLATPYTGDVNARIVEQYAVVGLEVVAEDHLDLADNDSFALAGANDIEGQVRAVATDAHAVAIMCTNVFGAHLVAGLERQLAIPVFDSVTISLWESLRLAGFHAPVPGFGTLLRDGTLRSRLQSITSTLLEQTGADRTTLRVDWPAHGLGVDLTAAESLGRGVRSIRRDGGLDQRRLNTVQWLEQHRRDLVQPDFRSDPTPPQALKDVYGVQAQMLGPVERDGAMAGWLSVHSLRERAWSDTDITALDQARSEVAGLLDRLA